MATFQGDFFVSRDKCIPHIYCVHFTRLYDAYMDTYINLIRAHHRWHSLDSQEAIDSG